MQDYRIEIIDRLEGIMKMCAKCNRKMDSMTSSTPEGYSYSYFKCNDCGDEIVDMDQLHMVAEKYRKTKQFHAKISKWGNSLGLRIPKELSEKYHLDADNYVILIQESDGIKIIVVP